MGGWWAGLAGVLRSRTASRVFFPFHLCPSGGKFTFDFRVSPAYPHEAPKVKCKTKARESGKEDGYVGGVHGLDEGGGSRLPLVPVPTLGPKTTRLLGFPP